MEKVDGRVRYTMKDLRIKYPDKWVILDDCQWANKSTIESGILVGICEDDEVSGLRIKNRHEGTGYMFRRTTEDAFNPFLQVLNFEVTAE